MSKPKIVRREQNMETSVKMSQTEKSVRAKELMAEINATLKGPVLKLGSDLDLKVEYLPTGILPIDILLQGGIPKGRFVEFYGDYSTLKSYVGLKAVANTQANGGVCALIDTEHSYDPAWAATLGVDTDSLIIQQPETGELAMDTAEALIRGKCDLIIFDSIAATLPQTERNKRLHDESVQPARQAMLMSLAMRKLTAANTKTAMVWINQTRLNVGVTFGNPESLPGGRAMPYYASYRINMKKVGKITRDVQTWDGEKMVATKEQIGQKFKAVVEKSKLSKPFRDVYFTWDYETGEVDEVGFLIALGLESGAITQNGASWAFNGTTVRGREKFKEAVMTDPTMQEAIRAAVLPSISPGSPEAPKKRVGRPKKESSNATE